VNIDPDLFCAHIVNGRPCGMMPRAHDGNALGHQFRRPDSARNVDEHSENADSGDDQESKPKRQPSVAAQLVQIALDRYDLFVSEDRSPLRGRARWAEHCPSSTRQSGVASQTRQDLRRRVRTYQSCRSIGALRCHDSARGLRRRGRAESHSDPGCVA